MRIKGQETTVTVTSALGVEESVADVKSCEITFERDILSEGYLGQKTEKKDAIFKGVTGKITFHVEKRAVLGLVGRINEATKNRVGGEQFEVTTTYEFEDGKMRIICKEVAFGSIPISSGSRDDFVELSFDFACEDGDLLAAA